MKLSYDFKKYGTNFLTKTQAYLLKQIAIDFEPFLIHILLMTLLSGYSVLIKLILGEL